MLASDLECKCKAKTLRIRTFRNGSEHYCFQCITCGSTDKCIPKADALELINKGEKLEAYDEDAASRYAAMLRDINNSQRAELKEQRLQQYNEYLLSDIWREKRRKVISRANNICEGCNDNKITQIHHLTYEHVYNELLFELVGLCDLCHFVAHSERVGDNE